MDMSAYDKNIIFAKQIPGVDYDVFPLPTFGVVPQNVFRLDPRASLRILNSCMKNTILRGLNRVHEVAPLISPLDQRNFYAFMVYTGHVLTMLELHLDGDEAFFTNDLRAEDSLLDVLGPHCVAKRPSLAEPLTEVQALVRRWTHDPFLYDAQVLRESLEFSDQLVRTFGRQLDAMSCQNLDGIIEPEVITMLLKENDEWLMGNGNPGIFIPYIMAHHDTTTNSHWPGLPAAGIVALPQIVAPFRDVWAFAPFDPLTGQPQTWTL